MFRHVPNILTGSRLVLAGAFFALLSFYQYDASGRRGNPVLMTAAFIIYIAAVVSDWLDGYLARKWKVEGMFGRVVDPFADKILVLGSFIFFAGKNFIIPHTNPEDIPRNVYTITGVAPWMVVVILARELLVTSLRNDAGAFKWRTFPRDVMQPEAERYSWIGPIDTASRGQLGIVQEHRFLMSVRGAANGPEQCRVVHIRNIVCGHVHPLRQSRREETSLHGRFRQSPRSQIGHDGKRGEQLGESEATDRRLLVATGLLTWLPPVHPAAYPFRIWGIRLRSRNSRGY